MINVCIAGATGWGGRALVAGVLEADDLVLRSAVARSAAGADLASALGGEALDVPVYGTVDEALDDVDVLTTQRSTRRHASTPVGVISSGNFSLTTAMAQAAAMLGPVGLTRGLDTLLFESGDRR